MFIKPTKNTYLYAGLFLISIATLMYEVLLTRIFSVATWYYFAFFAISLAMFGFTVGGLCVYFYPNWFSEKKLYYRLFLFSFIFAISIDLALLVFLCIPFYPRPTGVGVFSTLLVSIVIAIPFILSGIAICLCLTRFAENIGKFYAANLSGAAIGAFLVVPILNVIDAPSAVFLAALFALLGSIFFAYAQNNKVMLSRRWLLITCALVVILPALNANFKTFRVEWVKLSHNRPVKEIWNAFSRVAIYPPHYVSYPYSWGLSSEYKPKEPIAEMMMDIDGVSETVLTFFNGNKKTIEHLQYDVSALAHYLRGKGKIFIIGAGGGRDILTAHLFEQNKIIAVELNDKIVELLTGACANFTGRLDRLPGVKLLVGEGRNVLERSSEKFDIIQASCIATWSATTAGAYTLAENTLYTRESWKLFLEHLEPGGIISFTRWFSPDFPAQLLRLTSLAASSLRDCGIEDPAGHIIVVRNQLAGATPAGTILLSNEPFSKSDLDVLEKICKRFNFKIIYSPDKTYSQIFSEVIQKSNNSEFHQGYLVDISPPTDERPFFFHMLRLKDVLFKNVKLEEQRFNLQSIAMLFVLLLVAIIMTVGCILLPLLFNKDKISLKKIWPGITFFGFIGIGYMLVEVAQIQRLVIFLGHPIYSTTVVIFVLLFTSGLGALASNRITSQGKISFSRIASIMIPLFVLLAIANWAQLRYLPLLGAKHIAAKIFIVICTLMPVGFLMGFPFPLGMSIANKKDASATPWLWGINGAASVLASVLAV
ncbi:MAG: hypothetical protein JW869_07295, partial [Candidatus Omnitrophica bacterium]|nr:hypothetical protein [Candidatus Omnitrophota bacterium]